MEESRIELTERLRREGRMTEAFRFKDQEIARLRAEGLTRRQAGPQAWELMAEQYPPRVTDRLTAPAVTDDGDVEVIEAAVEDVNRWQAKYGLTLPDAARDELIGGLLFAYAGEGSLIAADAIPERYR